MWQSLRRSFSSNGLTGGSDAGAIIGLDDYRSFSHVFYDCLGVGYFPRKVNEIMLHGTLLEGYVANLWQYHDGRGVVENHGKGSKVNRYRRVDYIIQNPGYPDLFANLDFEIIRHHSMGKTPGVLEIKTISSEVSDKYTLGFPPKYVCQVQLYLLVTGLSWAELCWFNVGRREIKKTEIFPDTSLQNEILTAAEDLRRRVSEAKKHMEDYFADHEYDIDTARLIASYYEPDAQPGDAYKEYLSARHKAKSYDTECVAGDEVNGWYVSLMASRAERSAADDRVTNLENKIKKYMLDNGANVLHLDGGAKITWNKQFRINAGSND